MRLLGKFPTHDQIDKLSRFCVSTYLKRFGNKRALRSTFSNWLRAQPTCDPDDLTQLARFDRTDELPPNDRWLLHLWKGVRITFLPKSSDLKRYRSDWPELLIVDIHDWPAAPCPVHQITDLLRDRIKDLTTKSKTGPKPRPRP